MSPLDLPAGERVALLVPGSEEYVVLAIGLLARGVIPVPLDPELTRRERDAVLADASPAAVLTDVDQVRQVARDVGPVRDLLPLARPMHFTSGTTGSPKGVWSGLLDEGDAGRLLAEERDLWGFADDDVHLVVSPLHHSAPLRFAMGTLLAGGQLVLPPRAQGASRFDAAALTRVIAERRPSTTFCVPTHLQRLLSHWDSAGAPDLSCFRLLAHAGATCPPWVKERLLADFPAESTWEFYGSTEGQFTVCRSEEQVSRRGTVGRARPGRRLSVDSDGAIWCTAPPYARFGYFRAPDKTEAAWRADGEDAAFTVGDHGRLDADGYLYLHGRREDLVITGGVNVYPAEVESVLASHPGVIEVAVFGVPDDDWGQRVCAAVVGDVDEGELRQWAQHELAAAKRPKEYRFFDALPHTASGKVLRAELAEPAG